MRFATLTTFSGHVFGPCAEPVLRVVLNHFLFGDVILSFMTNLLLVPGRRIAPAFFMAGFTPS